MTKSYVGGVAVILAGIALLLAVSWFHPDVRTVVITSVAVPFAVALALLLVSRHR